MHAVITCCLGYNRCAGSCVCTERAWLPHKTGTHCSVVFTATGKPRSAAHLPPVSSYSCWQPTLVIYLSVAYLCCIVTQGLEEKVVLCPNAEEKWITTSIQLDIDELRYYVNILKYLCYIAHKSNNDNDDLDRRKYTKHVQQKKYADFLVGWGVEHPFLFPCLHLLICRSCSSGIEVFLSLHRTSATFDYFQALLSLFIPAEVILTLVVFMECFQVLMCI